MQSLCNTPVLRWLVPTWLRNGIDNKYVTLIASHILLLSCREEVQIRILLPLKWKFLAVCLFHLSTTKLLGMRTKHYSHLDTHHISLSLGVSSWNLQNDILIRLCCIHLNDTILASCCLATCTQAYRMPLSINVHIWMAVL